MSPDPEILFLVLSGAVILTSSISDSEAMCPEYGEVAWTIRMINWKDN